MGKISFGQVGPGLGIDTRGYNLEALFGYNDGFFTPKLFKLFDDSKNFTEFKGVGLTADEVSEVITGGTVTGVTLKVGGYTNTSVSGVSVDAVSLYNAAVDINLHRFLSLFSSGDDTIKGTKYNDLIHLGDNAGNDKMSGLGGSDTLLGGLGDDKIDGGVGDDVLLGEEGADILIGGKGADYFAFVSDLDSTSLLRDKITDFDPLSGDRIDLTLYGADLDTAFTTGVVNSVDPFSSGVSLVTGDFSVAGQYRATAFAKGTVAGLKGAGYLLEFNADGDADAEISVYVQTKAVFGETSKWIFTDADILAV
jgi:Ca2+-binding RTX toxin-like protein